MIGGTRLDGGIRDDSLKRHHILARAKDGLTGGPGRLGDPLICTEVQREVDPRDAGKGTKQK
jgi:hypothetical protein